MKKETKDRLVIAACAVGTILAAAEVLLAVVNIVLYNMGSETLLF